MDYKEVTLEDGSVYEALVGEGEELLIITQEIEAEASIALPIAKAMAISKRGWADYVVKQPGRNDQSIAEAVESSAIATKRMDFLTMASQGLARVGDLVLTVKVWDEIRQIK